MIGFLTFWVGTVGWWRIWIKWTNHRLDLNELRISEANSIPFLAVDEALNYIFAGAALPRKKIINVFFFIFPI